MPMVINVATLQQMLIVNVVEEDDISDDRDEEDDSPTPLFQLRSVCRRWRDMIDQLEDNLQSDSFIERETKTDNGHLIYIPWYYLNQLPLDPNNVPSFGRRTVFMQLERTSLMNEYDIGIPFQELSSTISNVLSVTRDQVWNIWFRGSSNSIGLTPEQLYTSLCQWMSPATLPNLESIFFEFFPMARAMRRKSRVSASLKQFIASNPFPHLEKLKSITISMIHQDLSVDLQIAEAILQSNPQIKEFTFYFSPESYKRITTKYAHLLNLVKSLELECFSMSMDTTMRSVSAFTNFNWPLKSISITCHPEYEPISISKMIRYFNRFPTMEHLRFKVDEEDEFIVDGDDVETLQLPNLISYNLELWAKTEIVVLPEFCYSIDYLLSCEKLATLTWDFHRLYEGSSSVPDVGEVIQFQGGLVDLYQENIWDIFPNLKVAKVTGIDKKSRTYQRKNRVVC